MCVCVCACVCMCARVCACEGLGRTGRVPPKGEETPGAAVDDACSQQGFAAEPQHLNPVLCPRLPMSPLAPGR